MKFSDMCSGTLSVKVRMHIIFSSSFRIIMTTIKSQTKITIEKNQNVFNKHTEIRKYVEVITKRH